MKTKITLFISAMLMAVFCTVTVHAQNTITFDVPPTEVMAGTNAIVKVNYTKDDAGAWAQVKLRNSSNVEVTSEFVAITDASGSLEFDMAIPDSALGTGYHWWAQIMNASWGGEGTVSEPFPEVTVLAMVNSITFDVPPTEVMAGTNAIVKVNYTKDDAGAWAQVKLRNSSNVEVTSEFVAITDASGSLEFDMAIPDSALGTGYHWWAQIMNASWGGEGTVSEPFPEVTVLAMVNSITFDVPPTEVMAGTTAIVKVNYTKDDAGAWAQVKLRNSSNAEVAAGLLEITDASGSIEFDMAIPDSALGTGYHWWAQIMNASWGGEGTVSEPFPEVTVLANTAPEPYRTVDFEVDGIGADWTWGYCCNDDNPPLEFVDNPDVSEPNLSAKVAKFTSRAAGDTWRLFLNSGDNGEFTFDAENCIIKMMVYKTDISSSGFKVEGGTGTITEKYTSNTVVNAWEEIEFDFTELIGQTFSAFVIMPDGGTRTEDAIVYIDNIQLPKGVVAEPVYNVTFTVVDKDDAVIEGADVVFLTETLTTSVDGIAVFTQISATTDAAYTVTLEGYEDVTGTLSVVDADVTEPITMNLMTYDVKFTVVDADDNVVVDAEVVLLETTVTTDASGVALFTDMAPVADAAYTVSKEGFQAASGTVSVVDADVDVDVLLTTVSIHSDLSMISNIYPNPTNGKLNIELNNSFNKAIVRVYSSLGQIVEYKELFEMNSVLDLSTNKAGIYLIKVELDDHMYFGKIVLNN